MPVSTAPVCKELKNHNRLYRRAPGRGQCHDVHRADEWSACRALSRFFVFFSHPPSKVVCRVWGLGFAWLSTENYAFRV